MVHNLGPAVSLTRADGSVQLAHSHRIIASVRLKEAINCKQKKRKKRKRKRRWRDKI
jgi:hypothetical protein